MLVSAVGWFEFQVAAVETSLSTSIEPIVIDVHLPAGVAGPAPLDFDVRCFLVTHASGVVLIDAGTVGSHDAIGAGLARAGARWDDITDVVLTHRHPDHVGGLAEVIASASYAEVWAGADDRAAIPFDGKVQGLVDGESVRELRVLHTPGHTPGHCSLALDEESILFAGDIVGSAGSSLTRGPAPFTADADIAEESLRRIAGLAFDRVLFGHGDEIPDPLGALRSLMAQTEAGLPD